MWDFAFLNSKAFLRPRGVHYSSLRLEINKQQIYTPEIDVFHKSRYNDDKCYRPQSARLQWHPLRISICICICNPSPPWKRCYWGNQGTSQIVRASHRLSHKKTHKISQTQTQTLRLPRRLLLQKDAASSKLLSFVLFFPVESRELRARPQGEN